LKLIFIGKLDKAIFKKIGRGEELVPISEEVVLTIFKNMLQTAFQIVSIPMKISLIVLKILSHKKNSNQTRQIY